MPDTAENDYIVKTNKTKDKKPSDNVTKHFTKRMNTWENLPDVLLSSMA